MWKANVERDEEGLIDSREDCTSIGLAAGSFLAVPGSGLFHGEAENK